MDLAMRQNRLTLSPLTLALHQTFNIHHCSTYTATTQYIRFGGGGNPEMAEMMRMRAEIWVWATDGGFSILHADVDRTPLPLLSVSVSCPA